MRCYGKAIINKYFHAANKILEYIKLTFCKMLKPVIALCLQFKFDTGNISCLWLQFQPDFCILILICRIFFVFLFNFNRFAKQGNGLFLRKFLNSL